MEHNMVEKEAQIDELMREKEQNQLITSPNHQHHHLHQSTDQIIYLEKHHSSGGNTETDSLQELIINYLNLIKSYKRLVEQLDQAKLDNSQLKISYNSLNSKYMKLKSTSDDDDEEEVNGDKSKLEVETYRGLVEDKYKQQIGNLKSAYDHLYELYEKSKREWFESYNKLHGVYLMRSKNGGSVAVKSVESIEQL
jgi:hypothetical protein